MSTLATILDELTETGELYESLENGAVRCYACGHRCLIREGKRGICQVRFNQGGKLRVPWGYVAALQSDPVEKKPFFHVLPGSNALTFGMLGCDFHCGYCFTGDMVVITNRGPLTLEDAFYASNKRTKQPDGEISFPADLKAITSSGLLRQINGVFRHPYHGKTVSVQPFYLPALQCTPDHRLFATPDISKPPSLLKAEDLTKEHFLAIPRKYHFSSPQTIHVDKALASHTVRYGVAWKLTHDERNLVGEQTVQGKTSREIGALLNKSGSYVRHVRRKLKINPNSDFRESGYVIEDGLLRFPNEHKPGIPTQIDLTANVARLLGYYCAEGSVVADKNRPNSFTLSFSFSKKEGDLANKVQGLLKEIFKVQASVVNRQTTLGVSVSKATLALLLRELAGHRATDKRVPELLFDAPWEIVKAYVDALVEGDGHRYENGKTSLTTVSKYLAYGVAWLVLKMGYLPSIYDAHFSEEGIVQGRQVKRAPHQYTVVWYETSSVKRRVVETDQYFLVPIREITSAEFNGDVYNMDVEGEHDYLANFLLVSNCQNWLTSQAMRDPKSDVSANYVRHITPKKMVQLAHDSGASIVVSSYNEPLITSEWAVAIFKEAKAAGLMCAYVSNGNNTPEVMEYLRPYISAYKVDLKCMQDKNYRKLGGVLQNTLDGIQRARDMGLWVEVVTLVVPGFNDSNDELWDAARFLAGVSPDIPWHVTAFHKDYKMTEPDNTPAQTLLRASEIGREAGLRYVYAGNIPGRVGEYESTFCPNCNHPVVMRTGYVITEYRMTPEGKCPDCGTKIPGIWPDKPAEVRLKGWGMPRVL
jgi:pyruvate formate lyase activating enzyme